MPYRDRINLDNRQNARKQVTANAPAREENANIPDPYAIPDMRHLNDLNNHNAGVESLRTNQTNRNRNGDETDASFSALDNPAGVNNESPFIKMFYGNTLGDPSLFFEAPQTFENAPIIEPILAGGEETAEASSESEETPKKKGTIVVLSDDEESDEESSSEIEKAPTKKGEIVILSDGEESDDEGIANGPKLSGPIRNTENNNGDEETDSASLKQTFEIPKNDIAALFFPTGSPLWKPKNSNEDKEESSSESNKTNNTLRETAFTLPGLDEDIMEELPSFIEEKSDNADKEDAEKKRKQSFFDKAKTNYMSAIRFLTNWPINELEREYPKEDLVAIQQIAKEEILHNPALARHLIRSFHLEQSIDGFFSDFSKEDLTTMAYNAEWMQQVLGLSGNELDQVLPLIRADNMKTKSLTHTAAFDSDLSFDLLNTNSLSSLYDKYGFTDNQLDSVVRNVIPLNFNFNRLYAREPNKEFFRRILSSAGLSDREIRSFSNLNNVSPAEIKLHPFDLQNESEQFDNNINETEHRLIKSLLLGKRLSGTVGCNGPLSRSDRLRIPQNTQQIRVEAGTTEIGPNAFEHFRSLEKIILPNNVTNIGRNAFENCLYLTDVYISNGTTSIGSSAFIGCESLTNIRLPSSITEIGGAAFSRCGFTSISLPNGITEIPRSLFLNCPNLTTVHLPDSVTSMASDSFALCRQLRNIDLPNGITEIPQNAFDFCNSLENINLPDSLTSIGPWAFNHCSSLRSITLPGQIRHIDLSAFRGCPQLEEVIFSGDEMDAEMQAAFPPRATIRTPDGRIIREGVKPREGRAPRRGNR